MAAIKFSKQYIEPNPNEIDYWVDLSSNQYGGRMKYHNGFEWVDLVNPDGTHIDINDFYNKLQINQMLSQKASVDSVESKVDDDEVSDVIKNISFSQRGEDGVEMVMFKYDDTTVGIQLPIADNTKSGIITKDTFKNLVNQTQLQQLYSEMYTKLSEIRNNYQPKLRAGANIKIENNVISAVSKIGTDWNDIANKPDIYDKSQVDVMISGVYKIKGSRRFEALPLYTNTVGDTYNITNDFSLHGEDYPMGTNVVWTENGWDALAGIFDTSDLEEDIQEVKDNYLPLSGGTMSGGLSFDVNLSTTASYPINFKSSTASGQLYLSENTLKFKEGANINKLWHSGNDGEDSGLDADTLDGRQGKHYAYAENTFEWDLNNTSGLPFFIGGYMNKGTNTPYPQGAFMHVGTTNRFMQFVSGENALMFRSTLNGIKGDWKQIATTDSNVASATKLATPVKLWGYSFDGSSDINDDLFINNSKSLCINNAEGEPIPLISLNSKNDFVLGYGSANRQYQSYLYGYVLNFYTGNPVKQSMVINTLGYVGIGTSNPQHRLDVDGNIGVSFENGVFFKNKENEQQWSIKSSVISGKTAISVRNELNTFNALTITESGNIGIGTNTPSYRLEVKGSAAIDNYTIFKDSVSIWNSLAVSNKIASGDLVDWYGVSWSEDSSDPTCIRIGNMALHRSLPIQSAMQGYLIGNTTSSIIDGIIPLNNDWNRTKYGFINNVQTEPQYAGNIMVKIPEFWYIDDYEPSTKTHNLKISQTAKAGWCHHKEAYVGAYEGYSDGTCYKSQKGQIPTVSLSRTELRQLARANGYEDEYKWNIYTYEEHRAICHLFLVEYATRNSQAPVNTELTADGFKQGGLGSGCTTGTATINGQTTYSFIPTGTTDSLGNGSGQVAYTVTQTDADGNEIGTVTRYANRYRGIENPFGHIWKHVDDIVNVYNAETTYKTVYKCDKPEHFATNKNAKYKPLCSFPGGSKMQGWSKEIKATVNCDFFKYSVGGSESTYWCDYNYDNDDTSEHCLLIGGHSDYGGKAGLFYFALNNGVGHSHVYIGSRLTYLPWAE